MRLIDADALKERGVYWYDEDETLITVDDIDAAPTVRCEECKSVQRWTFDNEPVMSCGHPKSPFLECDVLSDFGCAYFERREP